jgi:hypothetical protein
MRIHQTHRRIVQPFLVFVLILLNGLRVVANVFFLFAIVHPHILENHYSSSEHFKGNP